MPKYMEIADVLRKESRTELIRKTVFYLIKQS